MDSNELLEYKKMSRYFDYFIKVMWNMTPQPVKPEYEKRYKEILESTWDDWERGKKEITAEWFGDFNEETQEWEWYHFVKGENLTWQQSLIVFSINKANNGEAKNKISVVAGHGIGKTMVNAMAILWYLFTHYQAIIPCTANTAPQLYDVLWKEVSIWLKRMPENIADQYVWLNDYLKIKGMESSWFARARTSSKDNPEALAGLHADHMLFVVEEASGVPSAIFETAGGAMTGENVIVLMISNGTRITGYFYDSHHKNKEYFQTLSFNSQESPVVSRAYIEMWEEEYGGDPDKMNIRVYGGFARTDEMDDSGYLPLIGESEIQTIDYPQTLNNKSFYGPRIMGIDPSGAGDNRTVWVIRDRGRSYRVASEGSSKPISIAMKTVSLMDKFRILPEHVFVDSFGVGAEVAKEVALLTGGRLGIRGVNVGDKPRRPRERDEYENMRAVLYFRLRKWLITGGMVGNDKRDIEEIAKIFWRNDNKIKIMRKRDMKKRGIKSPDFADALSLTFYIQINEETDSMEKSGSKSVSTYVQERMVAEAKKDSFSSQEVL